MNYGKGIVKKYSREYVRTLKNGKKKKYKTEQIQITVSKNDDIYENKEEVFIIPKSNGDIENLLNGNLSSKENKIKSTNSEISKKDNLKDIIDIKEKEILEKEEKIQELSEEIENKDIESDIVSNTTKNLKNEINEKEEKIQELSKEIENKNLESDNALNDNIDLKNEINDLKIEIEELKNKNVRSNSLINKYKKFIYTTLD